MEVHNESSVKTGVATPVSPQTVTPAQLAIQFKALKDIEQEWTVSARATSKSIIQFSKAFAGFEDQLRIAEKTKASSSERKTIVNARQAFNDAFDVTKDVAKRYRAIAFAAKAKDFNANQHAYPPAVESIYEISKAFGPSNETERRGILAAVINGRLTVKASLEDVREIRNGVVLASRAERVARKTAKERRAAPASALGVSPESMSDAQIIEQIRTQGVTSPAKQHAVVKQIREAVTAKSAEMPTPVIVPSVEPSRSSRSSHIAFSDIMVEGATITGRFIIHEAKPGDPSWCLSLPPELNRAIQEAVR